MGKGWRPDNWAQIKADQIGVQIKDLPYFERDEELGGFEAGADAILEELTKLGGIFNKNFIVTCTPLTKRRRPPNGLLIFLPGEDKCLK